MLALTAVALWIVPGCGLALVWLGLLVPPLPETGQDVSWLDDWEANTLASLGDDIEAKLCRHPDEIQAFFKG